MSTKEPDEQEEAPKEEEEKYVTSFDNQQYPLLKDVIGTPRLSKALDPAMMGAGRIDKIIEFPSPTIESLAAAYTAYMAKVNGDAVYQVFKGINPVPLAKESEGFNYADVASVVEGAVRSRILRFVDDEIDCDRPPRVSLRNLLDEVKVHREERSGLDNNYIKRKIGYI